MRKVGTLAWTMTVLSVAMTLTIGRETAAAGGKPADHGMLTPAEIAWKDGPASLPKGAKVAVLEGNPAEPGLFTMRLKFPDGYRIPPH